MAWLSVAEAAEKLDVSDRQVRRLASDGELDARLVGSRWLIGADAVRDRARAEPVAGRPLSSEMAWIVLGAAAASAVDALDGDPLGGIDDRRIRHRVRKLLADAPPPERWGRWLRKRARPQRVWIHPGVVDRLSSDPRVHQGGGFAVASSGVGLASGDRSRLYVRADEVASVLADYRARPDEDGQIVLMVVPADVADAALGDRGAPVPSAVALLDLLDSSDARERFGAAQALADIRQHLVNASSKSAVP